jgi:HAD superfamily hydrolase (TIGR01549 family)
MYLIFDSYGTLMEMDDFYGRLQRNFARLGANLPLDAVKKAAHVEMRHYMKGARLANDLEAWNKLREDCAQALASALEAQGHKLELSKEAFLQVLSDSVVYLPHGGVKEVLASLKEKGIRLAVLSNWDFRLPQALEEAGLLSFFDFVLPSAQVGLEKPAREFFEKGVESARQFVRNLSPSECFYIGDHYEKDVVGARNAGLRPLWLVRSERDLASGDIHEVENDDVPRLKKLEDLLKMF